MISELSKKKGELSNYNLEIKKLSEFQLELNNIEDLIGLNFHANTHFYSVGGKQAFQRTTCPGL